MFIYKVSFILYVVFIFTEGQDNSLKLNLFREETEKSSLYCVISHENESTAVGLFNNNNKPVKSFKYQLNLSKLTKKSFFCDISTNENCKDVLNNKCVWKYDTSANYDLPRITDRRWEDFNIIESGRIYFVNVHNVTEKDQPLKLNLEVKIEKDAFIYLCDGMDPLNSNCHWFVIGGWKKNDTSKSIARICKKTELKHLYIEDIYGGANQNCSKHPDKEDDPYAKNTTSAFLSSSTWTTITLEKSNKTYSIKYRLNHTELIRSKNLDNFTIDVKHIFIASPSSAPGEWEVNKEKFYTGILQQIYKFTDKMVSSFYFSLIHPEDFRNNNDNKKEYKTYIKICKDICNNSFPTTTITVEEKPISNWTHFNLQLNNSTVKLFRENKTSSTTSFNFIPKYIVISSRNIAYWKKHDYGIFVAKNRSTLLIPFAEGIKRQRICIAIFVYCAKCNISFEIIDSEKTTLIKTTNSKQKSWEQVKLETILKKDAKMELKIVLDKANSDNPAFIGDITDCTGNVRIIKASAEKSDQISFKSLTNSAITPTNTTIVLTSSFENTFDALWLSKNSSCKGILTKQQLEIVSKCNLTTLNYEELIQGEKICFLSDLRKNSSSSNSVCEVLMLNRLKDDENRRSHIFLWLVGPITILLIWLFTMIYFKIKKKSTSSNSSWINIFPTNYSFLRSEIVTSNQTENTALETYDNKNSMYSCLIKVKDFGSYVKDESADIFNQFTTIDNLKALPHTIGSMPAHIRKNRYKNIIAYDSTRVILESFYNNVNDDYINANYITGYKGDPSYIATQGPMATTVYDFWRMIWQEKVSCIVMLTKIFEDDKVKCHKYWPDDDKTFDCCAFKITCTKSNLIQNDLTIRHLKVTFNNVERVVTQIHYEGWFDYKTAESYESVQKILGIINEFEGDGVPIVIHCSAGVGRTGSLILCDTALKMAKATSELDVYSIFYKLRQERMNMVQNVTQYEFSHKVIAYILENM